MPRVITLEPEVETPLSTPQSTPNTDIKDDDYTGVCGPRIRCPHCDWSPKAADTWSCACGHAWNTFDTGGVCPSCLHQWLKTQCLSCQAWAAHSDWYEY